MRKSMKTLVAASALAGALAAAPSIYAHDPEGPGGSMMGQGMMGMMNMMGQMNEMMESCNKMMRGEVQHPAPKTPKEGTTPEKEG